MPRQQVRLNTSSAMHRRHNRKSLFVGWRDTGLLTDYSLLQIPCWAAYHNRPWLDVSEDARPRTYNCTIANRDTWADESIGSNPDLTPDDNRACGESKLRM